MSRVQARWFAAAVCVLASFPSFGSVGQIRVASDCATTCRTQSSNFQRVGQDFSIRPRHNRSQLLIECTFNAHVSLTTANSAGNFRIVEGNNIVGHVSGAGTSLASFGASHGAPSTHRVVVENQGESERTFSFQANSVGSVLPTVSVTGRLCTITEIEGRGDRN